MTDHLITNDQDIDKCTFTISCIKRYDPFN